MTSGWDEAAEGWDDNPAVRAYAAAAWSSLCALLGDRSLQGLRVLDFGCGTGLLSTRLADAGASVVAVDVSAAMVARLQRKAHAGISAVVGTADDVSGPFDGIVASSVCGFLDDYPSAVRRLAAQLVPGGWFVQWDWERADDPAPGEEVFGLRRSDVEAALAGAGLTSIRVETAFELDMEGHRMAPLLGSGTRPLHDEGRG